MVTIQIERPFTYDDLANKPDDGNRYEIVNGVLFVSPSPNRDHQLLAAEIFAVVRSYVRSHHLGLLVFAPVDVRLGPYTVVEPDLLFLRRHRRDIYKASGVVEEAPDLVVEITSPSTAWTDTVTKLALYAGAGVPEYWLPNPETRTFRLLVLQDDGTYRDAEPVAGCYHSTVIAGLVIDPVALFASLD